MRRAPAPHAPVVPRRHHKQHEADRSFGWVIADPPDRALSEDSFSGSDGSHQSTMLGTDEGHNLAGEIMNQPSSKGNASITFSGEPHIVQDEDLPLRGAEQAKVRQAALAAKPSTPERGRSIVPTAFKFGVTKRSKSVGPAPEHVPASLAPPLPDGAGNAAPIHARFAKANRASWIEKKGFREAAKGPIIPSRERAPTLSFIREPMRELPPVAYIPARSATGSARSATSSTRSGSISSTSSESTRALSPVQHVVSLPSGRTSPASRTESPTPAQALAKEIDSALPVSTAIKLMYPKPAPTGPLPQLPVPRATTPAVKVVSPDIRVVPPPVRALSPVQRPGSTSPTQIIDVPMRGHSSRTNTPHGRSTPTLPGSGRYQVTVQKREVAAPPPSSIKPITAMSRSDSTRSTQLPYLSPVDTSRPAAAGPISAPVTEPPRAFSPAPPASSGLRRTPSLPPARRVEPAAPVIRGREHPFPLRPVKRVQPTPDEFPNDVSLEVGGLRVPSTGFYLSSGSVSASDVSTASLRLTVPRGFDPGSRLSDAPSSMYSDMSAVGSEKPTRLMSEDEHELRRANLVNNVGMLIARDGRVLV